MAELPIIRLTERCGIKQLGCSLGKGDKTALDLSLQGQCCSIVFPRISAVKPAAPLVFSMLREVPLQAHTSWGYRLPGFLCLDLNCHRSLPRQLWGRGGIGGAVWGAGSPSWKEAVNGASSQAAECKQNTTCSLKGHLRAFFSFLAKTWLIFLVVSKCNLKHIKPFRGVSCEGCGLCPTKARSRGKGARMKEKHNSIQRPQTCY